MEKEYDFVYAQMEMKVFQQTIDQLAEFPDQIKMLSLTGHGEPLLHANLPEMIAYAKKKQVAKRIEVISNGSLLTEKLSNQLIDAGLDCLRVSVQGLSSEKYKTICGFNLDFKEYIRQLTYFYQQKEQCELFVKIMDIALEKGEEELFYKMFDGISDRMFIEECKPVYAGVEMTKEMITTKDRYGREHPPRIVCPLCFFMLGVLPDGDVKPCDSVYKPIVLGNVKEQSLMEIWNSDQLKNFWILQLRKKRDRLKHCKVCCAPDDVSQPEDVLDDATEEIIARLGKMKD